MNDTVRFQLNQLMQDVRITPVDHVMAESRYARLSGYIDCLDDCGVISSSDAGRFREQARKAYIQMASA